MNINNNNFKKFAVEGVTERNQISDLFLSQKNIDFIQNKIIKTLKIKHNYNISNQSNFELLIIMRSIYLNNCTNNYKNMNDIKKEIIKLNDLVVNYSVDNIFKNIKSQELYLKKINNDLEPINLPSNTNSKGDKQLEFKSFF